MLGGSLVHILTSCGLLLDDKAAYIQHAAVQTGRSVFEILQNDGIVPFERLAAVLSEHFDIEYYDITASGAEPAAAALIDYRLATKYNAVPVKISGSEILLLMSDPFDNACVNDVKAHTGMNVRPALASAGDIKLYIDKCYGAVQIGSIASQLIVDENLRKNEYNLDAKQKADIQNAPAVRFIDSLIESAVLYRSSDIHIEPYESILRTRYRIDGILTEYQNVSIAILPNIIARLKIMGGMDISEKRLPQDGHFKINTGETKIDFRLSVIPTIYGEKAVIRLIYNRGARIGTEDLGFFANDLEEINGLFRHTHGAVLITGPTGSGKSTTLTAFLSKLNTEGVNIVTVEDPVENELFGVNQVNINPKSGLGFANALRAILRQDPDIIMIGEIRDAETASIAIRAAITGHLVLSTLHTNDAISAIMRLTDMGIEPYLVTAAIKGVISQRLVRRICDSCKRRFAISPRDAELINRASGRETLNAGTYVFEGIGCPKCAGRGYMGRFAVYEYMAFDRSVTELIETGASYDAIKELQKKRGMKTIMDNALANVLSGSTTVEELLRVAYTL